MAAVSPVSASSSFAMGSTSAMSTRKGTGMSPDRELAAPPPRGSGSHSPPVGCRHTRRLWQLQLRARQRWLQHGFMRRRQRQRQLGALAQHNHHCEGLQYLLVGQRQSDSSWDITGFCERVARGERTARTRTRASAVTAGSPESEIELTHPAMLRSPQNSPSKAIFYPSRHPQR